MPEQLPAIATLNNNKRLAGRFNAARFDNTLRWAAEKQYAAEIIRGSRALQQCSPESVATALLDSAHAGLSLSPTLGHAYLIPYKDTCRFQPGYRGIEHLAYQSGTVKLIQAALAHEKDKFRLYQGPRGMAVEHEIYLGDKPGKVVHAYCIAELSTGMRHVEHMTRAQIDACEKAAKSRPGGGKVWNQWWEEMAKKAVIRRASKHWPKDPTGRIAHAMAIMDQHDGIDFDAADDVEPEAQELLVSDDQLALLTETLLEAGIPSENATAWLSKAARAYGVGVMANLPASRFDEVRAQLKDRASKYVAEHGQN